ncbi:hypothetical protein [Psychrobacillus soli]|uniref:Uncharacterized protein n=1 Tax=Psychrobacillus soli TaxID=1543965 RepID=A0A544TDI3_9BACI|nr:hypothetical protein [Psychrobacillus soli]TQR15527.1 hypothetical protein FG383_07940 [Psychrobacillus soli]
MNKMIVSLMIVVCSIYLTGCMGPETEVKVSKNPNADIFQWEGLIYQSNIDWVDEIKLTKHELVGEVGGISDNKKQFSNGVANKLPIGAKIFSAKERQDILIVEYDENSKKYLALSEG